MNLFLWASAYLDKERDHFQRVFRNMDVEEIQQIFSTTQNLIHSQQDKEVVWLARIAGLGSGSMDVLYFAAQHHLQAIWRQGVCLRGFRAIYEWKNVKNI